MEATNKNSILEALNKSISDGPIASTKDWAEAKGFSHDEVVGLAKSETAHERLTMSAPITVDIYDTTEEGKVVLNQGSPEARLFAAIPEGGIKREELAALFGPALAPGLLTHHALFTVLAQGAALKNGWIDTRKEGTGKEAIVYLSRKASEIVDAAKNDLLKVVGGQPMTKELDYLVKRKWLVKKYVKVVGF